MWQSLSSWECVELDIKQTKLVTDDINLPLNPEWDWMPFLALSHAVVVHINSNRLKFQTRSLSEAKLMAIMIQEVPNHI